MSALIGFTLLLLYQVTGELVARLFDLVLPGPVIGLVLMWPSLSIDWIRQHVQAVADFLLANLSLLFIPVGVGVILHLDLLSTMWWQIAVALLVSTVLGLLTTVLLLRLLIKDSVDEGSGDGEPEHD
jgi:holin-like protein